jgi:hypothetical protein
VRRSQLGGISSRRSTSWSSRASFRDLTTPGLEQPAVRCQLEAVPEELGGDRLAADDPALQVVLLPDA